MVFLKPFLISLFSFLILDFIWLGFVMKDFNLRQLSEIGRIQDGRFDVLMPAALPVYVLMALSVVLFVLPKLGSESSLAMAVLWGAIMGIIVFAIYDLTNLAILKNYPVTFALADMAWGTFVYAAVTAITWHFGRTA